MKDIYHEEHDGHEVFVCWFPSSSFLCIEKLELPRRHSHAGALIVIHKYLRNAVIPIVPYLALGEKQADRQTFQVFKTWKV